jgi:CHAT domain-containing protein
LPGALKETRQIARVWKARGELEVLDGKRASEAALRSRAPAARYIHLATHGFFADPEFTSILHVSSLSSAVSRETTSPIVCLEGRNPLVLSGLVLAGANLPVLGDAAEPPHGEDGFLTAEEVIGLDLRNTDLVVLSACETGLGRVAGGEGVFGLQRAFTMAGARTVVASLWKVDDQATRVLMERFYDNHWNRRMGKLEALREAQLWLLKEASARDKAGIRGADPPNEDSSDKDGRLPPYYWASFTLSGDWR